MLLQEQPRLQHGTFAVSASASAGAHNAALGRALRRLQVAQVPCAAHAPADIMEIIHRIPDGDQQVLFVFQLRQVHRGVGVGIRPFLHVLRVVAQHQRPGALRAGAHKHRAPAHFRQARQCTAAGRPRLPLRCKGDVQHRVASGHQVHAQPAHLAHHRVIVRRVALVGEQAFQQLVPQEGVLVHRAVLQRGQVFPFPALFLNLAAGPVQHVPQLLCCHRLQQVLPHAQADCLPGIFKVVISGQDNPLHPRHRPLHLFAQLHPVHKRHPDIRQQDIHVQVADHRQGHFPVRRLAHQLESLLLPGKGIPQVFPDGYLIVYQKDLHHGQFPPLTGSGSQRIPPSPPDRI